MINKKKIKSHASSFLTIINGDSYKYKDSLLLSPSFWLELAEQETHSLEPSQGQVSLIGRSRRALTQPPPSCTKDIYGYIQYFVLQQCLADGRTYGETLLGHAFTHPRQASSTRNPFSGTRSWCRRTAGVCQKRPSLPHSAHEAGS